MSDVDNRRMYILPNSIQHTYLKTMIRPSKILLNSRLCFLGFDLWSHKAQMKVSIILQSCSVKITWDYRTVGIPSKILNPSNPQDFINTPGNYTLGIILEIILVKLSLNTFLLLLNSLLALATPHRWIAFIHLDCRAVMLYSTER